MFYSQNFAPNETFGAYTTIPGVIKRSASRNGADFITMLEKRVLEIFFPAFRDNLSCTMFFSGRSALYHLLKSLDLENNSEVIIQSFTCTAVAAPIIHAGFKPVYADIDEYDFSAQYDSVLSKVSKLTKAIVLQHTFGIKPTNREKIINICREREIFLIEDLAHGLDPNTYKTPENLDNYAVLLSFGRSKLVSSVFGACVVTPKGRLETGLRIARKSLSETSKPLVLQCLTYKYLTPVIKSALSASQTLGKSLHKAADLLHIFPDEVVTEEKRGNFYGQFDCKYPPSLSEILLFELDKLPNTLSRNQENAELFARELNIRNTGAILRFPYVCKDSEQKNKILSHFKQMGIILGTWYESPVAPIDADLTKLGYNLGDCPTCERICKSIVNLPLSIDTTLAKIIAKEMKTILNIGNP